MIDLDLQITAAGHVAGFIALYPEKRETILKYFPGVDMRILPKYGDYIANMLELIEAGATNAPALSIAIMERSNKVNNEFIIYWAQTTADYTGDLNAIEHARWLAYKTQRMIVLNALTEGKEPSELAQALRTIEAIQNALPDPVTIQSQLPEVINRLTTPGDFMIPNPMAFAMPRINFLYRGGYHLIAARPGGGKTSVLVQIAKGLAIANRKVFFASYEMELTDFIARLILLDDNDLTSDDIYFRPIESAPKIWAQMGKVEAITNHITFVDNPGNIDVLLSLIRAAEPDVVIIDYIQLIPPSKETKRAIREQQISDMSRKLKNVALELKIPVVIASQLNRDATGEPILAHLRESGSLEQDADTVTFYWSIVDDSRMAKTAKNRRGPLGLQEVAWYGPKMKFSLPEREPVEHWNDF